VVGERGWRQKQRGSGSSRFQSLAIAQCSGGGSRGMNAWNAGQGQLGVRGWRASKAHSEEAPQRATTGRGRRNSIQARRGAGRRQRRGVERRGCEGGEADEADEG
jgi:hypothetical protein